MSVSFSRYRSFSDNGRVVLVVVVAFAVVVVVVGDGGGVAVDDDAAVACGACSDSGELLSTGFPTFILWGNYCIYCLLFRVVTEREVDDDGSVSFFWWYEFECVELGGADAAGGGAAAAASAAVANCQEREGQRRDVSNWGLGAIAGEE